MNEPLTMNPTRINYEALGLPVGPYTHAVLYNNTLHTSGVTAFGTPAESLSIQEQLREIFRQIEFMAKQQGSSLEKLIKVTIYITDIQEIAKARDTLFHIYGNHIPASSLIQVQSLFSSNLKVEVEAVLAVDLSSQ